MKPFFDYQLYIFDLDNTLYKETDYLFGAYETIGTALGNKDYADFLKTTFIKEGRTLLFNKLIKKFSLAPDTIDVCLRIMRTYLPANPLKLYPEIISLLDELKSKDKQLALLTNGNVQQQKNKIKNIAPAISSYFPIITFANESSPKPSPIGVDLILKQTGISKSKSLMIGDGENDELTAKNGGLDFIYAEQLPKTIK